MRKQYKARPEDVAVVKNEPAAAYFLNAGLNFTFWAVVAFAVLFRIYKAHNTGIIFDEVWTYEEFCGSLRTAVSKYHTNNHLLNSICIVIAQRLFGWYEHFLRIPSLISGIVFCFAVAAILKKTVDSIYLQITGAALILFNWFIFDLSYLGRGYALALGAVFTGILVLISISTNKSFSHPWIVMLFFIVVNVTAMGSMLSSLPIVLSFNSVCAIWLLSNVGTRKDLLKALARLAFLAVSSCVLLYILYNNVIGDIRNSSKNFGVADPFCAYMKQILCHTLIYLKFDRISFNFLIYKAFILMLVVCLIICAVRYLLLLKNVKCNMSLLTNPASIIIFIFVETFILMWVQRVIFDVSLGLDRNGVFLFVSMLLAAVAIVDKSARTLAAAPAFSNVLYLVCIIIISTLTLLNRPSANAVQVHPWGWAIESSIGPLARTLKQMDPYKEWKIRLVGYTKDAWRPIRFYRSLGYKIELVDDESCNVSVMPRVVSNSHMVCVNDKRFAEHHCCVNVNPALLNESPVFYEVVPAAIKK